MLQRQQPPHNSRLSEKTEKDRYRYVHHRIRARAGMSLLASAIGLTAFGAAVGTANAAPSHQPEYGTYTCFDPT